MNDDIPRSGLFQASPSTTSTIDDDKSSAQHIVQVSISDERWHKDCGFAIQAVINKAFEVVLRNVVSSQVFFELSVLLTNNAEIQELNRTYRQKDKPTNVLSFESGLPIQTLATQLGEENALQRPIPLGDIVLSYDTLDKEAVEQNKTFQDHFTHLVIHGLLHLLAFDHEEDEEAERMEAHEIQLLQEYFNISNPYQYNNKNGD